MISSSYSNRAWSVLLYSSLITNRYFEMWNMLQVLSMWAWHRNHPKEGWEGWEGWVGRSTCFQVFKSTENNDPFTGLQTLRSANICCLNAYYNCCLCFLFLKTFRTPLTKICNPPSQKKNPPKNKTLSAAQTVDDIHDIPVWIIVRAGIPRVKARALHVLDLGSPSRWTMKHWYFFQLIYWDRGFGTKHTIRQSFISNWSVDLARTKIYASSAWGHGEHSSLSAQQPGLHNNMQDLQIKPAHFVPYRMLLFCSFSRIIWCSLI